MSATLPVPGRVLALLAAARAGKGSLPASEAARLLGVPQSRLRATLDSLCCVGVPPFGPTDCLELELEPDAQGLRLRVRQAAKSLSEPLSLSPLDAALLGLGLTCMKEGLPKSLRPAWERVLQTVQGAVAGGLQDETESRAGSIAWQVEEGVDPDLLERLGRAVSESRELRITYWNAARNELGPRRCVPRKLAQHKGRWYLVAWDLERQAERQFRVDRVLGMEVVGPAGEGGRAQAAAGRRRSLRRDVLFDGDGDGVTARVRFDAADWDKARRFFRGAEADGGAERVLRVRSATLPTLLRSLFTFGEGWELLEPEEGRVMLRDWTASATA